MSSATSRIVMSVLVLALIVSLLGNLFMATTRITMPQMRAAVDLCRVNGGLVHIDPSSDLRHTIQCANKATFKLPHPVASKYDDPIDRNPSKPTTE